MEIFKLFGSILVDSSEAENSIQKTESKALSVASSLGAGIKQAAKWGAAIATGAAAAFGGLMKVATGSADAADEVDKMSQKIGLSKEGFQEWKYAMGQSGVDISVMQNGVKTLTGLMDKAKDGTASAQEAFDALGVSIYNADGALKDQESMMKEAIMALASMEDSTERARLSTELFGRAGTELEPLLNSGADGIEELMNRAHDLGLVMSDEAVNAGVVFGDTLADVKDSLGMVVTNIGAQVMPMLQGALDWVLAHMPEIQSTVSTVLSAIGAAIGALSDFWAKYGDLITEKVEAVMDFITTVVGAAMDILLDLVDVAMKALSGDWEGAWDGLVDVVKNIGTALYDAGKQIFSQLWDGIKSVWDNIAGWVSEKVNWLADKLMFWRDGSEEVSGNSFSHASGLAYVPYDNYPATLHRGETVLNATDAASLLADVRRSAAGTGTAAPTRFEVKLDLDGQTLARKMFSYDKREGELRGGSLVEVY